MRASITAFLRAIPASAWSTVLIAGALAGCPNLPSEPALDAGGDAGDANCSAEPTAPGCPCATEGSSTACYPTWGVVTGETLICDIGSQVCQGGEWSACGNIERVEYATGSAIINPPETCNPCSPTCTRAVDEPRCTAASCDLCTVARRDALIAMGMPPCIVNTSDTTYDPTRGGITPVSTPPVAATLPDSDGDGIPDVADMCPGRGAFLAADGTCYGDLFFYHSLPYGGPAAIDPAPITLQLRTADVYVMMDTTGSMGGELTRLRTDLTTGTFITGCANGILGAIRCTIPDAWFGVTSFDDVPYYPYGDPGYGDQVLGHRTDITATLATAQAGVNALGLHYGVDGPEGNVVAMWAGVTGSAVPGYLAARTSCPAGRWGYPCFRSGTIPIMIQITDAPFHNGPPDADGSYNYGAPIAAVVPTWNQVVSALNARDMRVMTIQSCGYWSDGYCLQGERVARALGNATGSLGSAGTPYVFRINENGTGMTSAIVNAVRDLANYSRMDVSARASGDTAGFTQSITAVSWGVGSCTGISGGTVFTQCLPGTNVNFSVNFRNNTVMSTAVAQVFTFYIEIMGDGSIVLARIPVRIVVPPLVGTFAPEGRYFREYDSTTRCNVINECVDWNGFRYAGTVPPGTRMRFEFRTTAVPGTVATATPIVSVEITTAASSGVAPYAVSGVIDVGALLTDRNLLPFLRAEAVLISNTDRTLAPSLSSMEMQFACAACR